MNMANFEQLKTVARNCSKYEIETQDFVSSVNPQLQQSCTNCKHLVNQKCELGLTDKIAANLDEK
ncbi:hypothetical protein SH2C18_51920 [Clostridium sediminicola]|uniref:hypothetical protein n=1 Tax=Clostridium sediminicola TaxID=3114879 RepID=UPI0031F1E59B